MALSSHSPHVIAGWRLLASPYVSGRQEGEMAQRSELKRFDAMQRPRIVGPRDGRLADLGSIAARMMVWTEETGGGFSLVEHPMPPRRLAAPIHKHSR